jgi:hypothetical protein
MFTLLGYGVFFTPFGILAAGLKIFGTDKAPVVQASI